MNSSVAVAVRSGQGSAIGVARRNLDQGLAPIRPGHLGLHLPVQRLLGPGGHNFLVERQPGLIRTVVLQARERRDRSADHDGVDGTHDGEETDQPHEHHAAGQLPPWRPGGEVICSS